VNVRSEPHDARIEDSARLNLRAVMVSMEVGKVRLDTGAVLEDSGSGWQGSEWFEATVIRNRRICWQVER
jgi:hypothetical protein